MIESKEVHMIDFKEARDSRGKLVIAEGKRGVPFDINFGK